MKNEAVKIAQAQERARMYECVRDILTDRAVVTVLGIVLIEYLQSSVNQNGQRVAGGGWMGSNVGTALETALGAYLLAPSAAQLTKEVGPLLEAIGKGSGAMLSGLGSGVAKAAPALLTAGV